MNSNSHSPSELSRPPTCGTASGLSVASGLTDEQQQRLAELLDRYLQSLEQDAPLNVAQLLEGNADLAPRLESYLRSLDDLHGIAAGFSSRWAPAGGGGASPGESAGERCLGGFRLLREVGRGGMGVVYEAQQVGSEKRVALKLLPFASVLDARQIERFKNEAQAASHIQHPHIVPVLAFGCEHGVHYYAMPFIDGQPLSEILAKLGRGPSGAAALRSGRRWIVSSQSAWQHLLPVPGEAADTLLAGGELDSLLDAEGQIRKADRQGFYRAVVRWMIQAAEALHAAHEYGIVHRDIKPSNLILDGDGKLWVTDFGLARIPSDASLTRTGDVVGTLQYMSPEQAAGKAALVDHRTDVYSLGATLYELLALEPPPRIGQAGTEAPPPLRERCPGLPRDLVAVVHTAMAAAREQRYATARELAEDLQRVLEGAPTRARPLTFAQRAARMARRHRRIVCAAGVLALTLMVLLAVGLIVIGREKLRAQRNLVRAEQFFRDAHRAVDRFGVQLADRLAQVPGTEQVRREALQDAFHYYERLAARTGQDPALQCELAMTFSQLALLSEQAGNGSEALRAAERAVTIMQPLAQQQDPAPQQRQCLAHCLHNLALLQQRGGHAELAGRNYRQALQLQQPLVARFPSIPAYSAELARIHNHYGLHLSETNAPDRARSSYRSALRLQQALVAELPASIEYQMDLAATYNNLAGLESSEQPPLAIALHEQAIASYQQIATRQQDHGPARIGLAKSYNNLAALHSRRGDLAEARDAYQQAIAIQRQLVERMPSHATLRQDLAVSLNNLGMAESRASDHQAALASLHAALAILAPLAESHPRSVQVRSSLGGTHHNLAKLLEQMERYDEAIASFQNAIVHQRAACDQAGRVTRRRLYLNQHYVSCGRLLQQQGRVAEAIEMALAQRQLWPNDPQRLVALAEQLLDGPVPPGAAGEPRAGARRYQDLALETLQLAVQSGLPPADLRSNRALAVLRQDARFQKLCPP